MADFTDVLSGDTQGPPSFMDSEQAVPDTPDQSPSLRSSDLSSMGLGTPAITPTPGGPQGQSPTPAAPTPTPVGTWRNILQGALQGMLSGAAGASQVRGRSSFGQGFGAGAGQALEDNNKAKQLQIQQNESASRIKFQDAQAANFATETLIKDKQLHMMDQQEQDRHNEASLTTVDRLQALGISPTLVVPNNTGGQEAQEGLAQLTDSHGAVPPLFTVNVGHQILAYDLTQLAAKPQILQEVNKVRAIQGAPALDQQTWQRMDPKARNEITNSALNFNTPMPSEESLLQYKNYLATQQTAPDSPERTANVALLTGITNRMQSSLDAAKIRATAQANEQAKATGQFQKNMGDAAEAQARVNLLNAQVEDMKSGTGGDEFDPSWTSPLNKKEFLKRQDAFVKSQEYKSLQQVQGSKQLFDKTVSDIGNGNWNGADSIVGLFAAIGISVTPMQGKGMRINKDVILSHEQARGLNQATIQKLESLKNGEVITPKQLKDYAGIADGVYTQAYINANDSLKQQGLPQNLLPEGHNQQIDQANAQIFLTLAGGDKDKARQVAMKHGWKF